MAKNKLKILAVADGFGDSVACPLWYPEYIKWPTIIGLMTKDTEIANLSRYGAGNEFIATAIRQHCHTADVVLSQWAQPNRLDLKLSHSPDIDLFWKDAIHRDKVYCDNIVKLSDSNYWLSSGSSSPPVIEYHKKFVSFQQHQDRSRIFVEYVNMLLNASNKKFVFFLSTVGLYLNSIKTEIEKWAWHQPWQGMCEFRHVSEYADLDLGVTQPLPLIQFDFINQFIRPKIDLNWRTNKEITAVENMLYKKYLQYKDNKPKNL
jgi:hypothetical protein